MTNVTSNRNESSFGELFEQNCQFAIPPFQRPYTWKKTHLSQLKLDIDGLVDGEESVHFMGAIIDDARVGEGATDTKTFEVIDGQQRLTSVYILICAAVSVYLSIEETDEAVGLAETYVFLRRKGQLKTKVVPSMTDRQDLNLMLISLLQEGLEKTPSFKGLEFVPLQKLETTGLILKNYAIFKSQLKAIYKDYGLQRLRHFMREALNSLHVVEIVVQDPSAGPKIFDSLNSKQAPITTGDLVRNEIFSKVALTDSEKARRLDEELWSPFYKTFARPGEKEREMFDKFFFPFGLVQNGSLKKNDVFTYLQKQWRGLDPTDIIAQLSELSLPYQDLVFLENRSGFESEALQSRVLNLGLMKVPSATYPFIMKVLAEAKKKNITEENAASALFEVEKFMVKRAICSIEPTGLHSVFKRLWSTLNGDYSPEAVRLALASEKTVEYPSEDKVTHHLTLPLYGKGVARFFLWTFDRELGGDSHAKDVFKSFWIEHVLPQNYETKQWPSFGTEADKKLVDIAGNLVPLTSEMNNGLGRKSYEVKRLALSEDSKFKSARQLASQNETWFAGDILRRNSEITAWALEYWG